MCWFKLDPIAAAYNIVVKQLLIPRQLAEMTNFENTPPLLRYPSWLFMATWTGIYQTVSVPMLQADQKTQVNMRQIPPSVCWGYAHFCCVTGEAMVSLLCEVTHERNLWGGTTFWGCLMLFRVWQAHCLYNINTKLMILGNSTHEWSRKLPDMPNKTSAKCTNCSLQNIFTEEKDGREERVKTQRGRDKQRTDGLQ